MSANRRRRQASQTAAGGQGWLVTYADMVTLLLYFFIMMFAFSNTDKQKFQLLIESLQGSLGVLDGGRTISPTTLPADPGSAAIDLEFVTPASDTSELDLVYERLQHFIDEEALSATVTVYIEEHTVVVRFQDQVLFDLGRAEIREEFQHQLLRFVEVIDLWPHQIRVEGHTDTLPIQTPVYPSNWELSTARATAVVRFFIAQGIEPRRLSAAGFGEYWPISDNETAEGRALNRRVDVVLYRSDTPGSASELSEEL